MLKNVIKVGSKGSIKGIAHDVGSGKLFVTCYDNKTIYYYKMQEPYTAVNFDSRKFLIFFKGE